MKVVNTLMDFNISIVDLLSFCRYLNPKNKQNSIELFLFVCYMLFDYNKLWESLEHMGKLGYFKDDEIGYLKYYRYEKTKHHLTAYKTNNKIIYNTFICIVCSAFSAYYTTSAVELLEYENNYYEIIINPLIKVDIKFTKEINGALYNYGNIRGEIIKMAKGFIITYQNDLFDVIKKDYIVSKFK